jgi:GAF domain
MVSEGKPASEIAARAEQALAALDKLTDDLRAIDRLKENVAALVVENQRLYADNVRLAHTLVTAQQGQPHDIAQTLRVSQEKARLYHQQAQDLLEVQTELESRVLELEELNSSMMSMYVSSFRLHGTLDLPEVIRVIEEIIVNFIGARSYAILLVDDDGETFRVAAEQGLDGRLPSAGIRPRGVLAEVVGSLTAYVHTSSRAAREGILAAVPLAMGKACVGALLVYSLLSQKDRLLRNDVDLFSLLGGHAASAIVSSRLYGKADRKVKTLQAMLNLLDEAPPSDG